MRSARRRPVKEGKRGWRVEKERGWYCGIVYLLTSRRLKQSNPLFLPFFSHLRSTTQARGKMEGTAMRRRMSFTFTIMLTWMWVARGRENFLRCQYEEWKSYCGRDNWVGISNGFRHVLFRHTRLKAARVMPNSKAAAVTDGGDGIMESVFSLPSCSSVLPFPSSSSPSLALASVFPRIFVRGNDTISMQMMDGRTE